MEKEVNSVMCMLHAYALEAVRMKAIEIIVSAETYNNQEPDAGKWNDVDLIKRSAEEFLKNLDKTPFCSDTNMVSVYRGVNPLY